MVGSCCLLTDDGERQGRLQERQSNRHQLARLVCALNKPKATEFINRVVDLLNSGHCQRPIGSHRLNKLLPGLRVLHEVQ
jgi:hypothetical protein